MWLKSGEDVKQNAWGLQRPVREPGAHAAFAASSTTSSNKSGDEKGEGPIRELLVAGGKDLQERKKMLLENADGLGK